jgi:hypothetical protein
MSSFSIVASNVAVGNSGTSTHCFRTLASGQLSLGRDNTALESNVVILGKLSLSGLSTGTALISDAGANISSSGVTATELGYVSGVTSGIQTQLAGKQPTITGAATTVTSSNLTASRAMVSDSSGKVGISSVTTTELGYVSGVTSGLQTQLDSKQPTITGAATTVTSSNLTASRAMVSDSSGKVGVSSVTAAELGYVSGTTGSIQTQIDNINGGAGTGTNLNLSGNLTAAGNVSATGYILGNGALLSGVATTSGTNLSLSGNLSASGNIVSGGSVVAQTGNFAAVNISASGITTGSLAVLGDLSASSLTMGSTSTLRQVTEILNAKTGATGVVAHDFTTGTLFYHSSIAANFTCNVTNVPTTDGRTIVLRLILGQGSAYMCNALQIDGAAQTIKWAGGSVPARVSTELSRVEFTLIRTGAAWYVLGASGNYS